MQILENTPARAAAITLESKLLKEKIIMISDELDSYNVAEYQSELIYLSSICQKGDTISIYINSPGGCVYEGLGLYDTIQLVKNKGIKVRTINIGKACSMAAIILLSGSKGYRESFPHASVMLHELSYGDVGKLSSMKDSTKEAERIQDILNSIIKENTNFNIEDMSGKDIWLSPEDAIKSGIIDKIVV